MKGRFDLICWVTIGTALLGFLIAIFVSVYSSGLDRGLVVGELELDEYRTLIGEEKISFSIHGPRTYVWLRDEYGLISVCFVLSIFSTLMYRIRNKAVSEPVAYIGGFLTAAFILYRLRILLVEKLFLEPYFWEAQRNLFLYKTITIDWVLSAITIGLLVLLFSAAILRYREFRTERISRA